MSANHESPDPKAIGLNGQTPCQGRIQDQPCRIIPGMPQPIGVVLRSHLPWLFNSGGRQQREVRHDG